MSGHRVPLRLIAPLLLATAAAVLWMAAAPAAAHEHYTTDPYEFIVGWRVEPPVVGAPNGLDLAVMIHGPANSTDVVEGAEADLSATLMAGGQSAIQNLAPQEGRAGWYTFDFIPTREGSYSVHITGNLNGTAIDFTAALEPAEARDEYEFPVADPTPSDLQGQLNAATAALAAEHANAANLTARVANLEAQTGSSAASAASTATLIALLGMALGAVGAGLGAMAMMRGKPPK